MLCMQILGFMQENDTHLPALCCLPSMRPVSTSRLAAFTHDRFFRALAASGRSPVHGMRETQFQVPAAEADAVNTLFDIIEGEAPGSMSLREVSQLMAVTKYYLADEVMHNLPQYIAPALQQASAQEVCFLV